MTLFFSKIGHYLDKKKKKKGDELPFYGDELQTHRLFT